MQRHFGATPDYWLDHLTLHDWRNIYHRELVELPPADEFIAGYFGHEPPVEIDEEDSGFIDLGLPDYEA